PKNGNSLALERRENKARMKIVKRKKARMLATKTFLKKSLMLIYPNFFNRINSIYLRIKSQSFKFFNQQRRVICHYFTHC
ncbi:hypothetical protein OLT92_08910, partial [Campylobacter jejuni]|nr:hypothetical protein [Campylobacter jejuni]